MSNSYFDFKQFTINQEFAAMKVGTDGVLLGAWANCENAKKILDVGTGTGLIAIMLAQRTNAIIDATEIEENAYFQAKINVENCKWKNRINVINCALQDYVNISTTNCYDLIVSNPPFFINSLKTGSKEINLARHNDNLPHSVIISATKQLLSPNGKLCLIYPPEEAKQFIFEARMNYLHCSHITNIKHSDNKPVKRLLLEFSFLKGDCKIDDILLKKRETDDYSPEYKELTKDYYLAF